MPNIVQQPELKL